MATYPGKITSDHPQVVAVLNGESYAVHFPYSAEAVKCAKDELPAPKWDRTNRVWIVKKRWHKKIGEVLSHLAVIAGEGDQMQKDIAAVKAAEKEKAEAEGLAAISAMKPFNPGSIDVSWNERDKSITLKTAYHPDIVTLFRKLGGKYQDGVRSWVFPLAAGVEIAANRDRIRGWHNETVMHKKHEDEAREKRRANRMVVRADGAPQPGTLVRHWGAWMKVETLGKAFTADDALSSMGGPIGIEGEKVRYAYLMDATQEEIAEAERLEEAKKQRAEAIRQMRDAIAEVGRGELAPDTGMEPAGTIIWCNDKASATGYREWIIHGDDGYLYHLVYDGSDGAAWGTYNAGYNTVARRVPASPDLIGKIAGGGNG